MSAISARSVRKETSYLSSLFFLNSMQRQEFVNFQSGAGFRVFVLQFDGIGTV
jgi:hypothetical protein